MAKSKKNRYDQKAHRADFIKNMQHGLPTKGNIKNTAIETGKDLLIGVVGGGILGAAIGRPSLLAGIAATGLGHFTGQRLVSLVGIGMMAAGGFKKNAAVSGMEGLDGVKERLLAYRDNMKEKFYLDKIMKKKDISGFGNLQYFNYPDEVQGLNGGLAALDAIDSQLEESALNRLEMGNIDAAETVEAMEGGLADVEDYNL
ncbi:hypothetical protein [Chitinophaga hostae]|uniref:hypothetical protein n=1 Tax=Chitinophaga hostae TaxID=2831022 RepID=UPI003F6993D1